LAPFLDGIGLAQFVLLRFDWSRLWGKPEYFEGYPVLSEGAAALLARSGLKGVGVDCISVDPIDTTPFPAHLAYFRSGMVIIENRPALRPCREIHHLFLFSPETARRGRLPSGPRPR
jgi:kynurenine formamidase